MDARNNYAHPTFESPTENQVISYLYFAVEYVLKKPPYYSFLYAKSLIENHLAVDPFYWEGKNNIQIQNYAKKSRYGKLLGFFCCTYFSIILYLKGS